MTEYFIRNLTPRTFQIAKFEDTKEPESVYKVTENVKSGYFHCDCPGFRRDAQNGDAYLSHKHIVMAIAHVECGFNYFDENFNGKIVF